MCGSKVAPATASRTTPLRLKGRRPPRRLSRTPIRCDSASPRASRAGADGV